MMVDLLDLPAEWLAVTCELGGKGLVWAWMVKVVVLQL